MSLLCTRLNLPPLTRCGAESCERLQPDLWVLASTSQVIRLIRQVELGPSLPAALRDVRVPNE